MYACNIHDLCYSYTNDKKICDQALLYNLLQKCSLPGAGPLCKELSMVGYYAVEAAGRILDFHRGVKLDCDKISDAFRELYRLFEFPGQCFSAIFCNTGSESSSTRLPSNSSRVPLPKQVKADTCTFNFL